MLAAWGFLEWFFAGVLVLLLARSDLLPLPRREPVVNPARRSAR